MNLILKAIDTKKSKIRQFPVTLSGKSFAVIYEYQSDYETFLPDLIEGIRYMTSEDVTIYCASSQMYSEIEGVRKVTLTDDKVVFTEPNNKLTTNPEQV